MSFSDIQKTVERAVQEDRKVAETFGVNRTSSADKTLNLINEGLRALPFIGGFIPETTSGAISISKIRDAVNRAVSKIKFLSDQQSAKLNSIIDQIEKYGSMIGSPSLMAFARQRKNQAMKERDEVEKTIDQYQLDKDILSLKAEDAIAAPAKDRYTTSDTMTSLSKTIQDVNNLGGTNNNVQTEQN